MTKNFVKEIENTRQQFLKPLKTATYVAVAFLGLGILFLIFAFVFMDRAFDILFLIFIICLIIAGVTYVVSYYNANNKYVKKFKNDLTLYAIKQNYGENYEYFELQGLSLETMSKCGFTNHPDRFTSKRCFNARKGTINFISSDYVFSYRHTRTDSKGNTTTYYNDYPGRFIRYEVNKDNKAYMTIFEKIISNEMFKDPRIGEKIEFESIEFNEKFTVKCSDTLKANYLITPVEQVNLIDFDVAFKSHLKIAIDGRFIYVFMASYSSNIPLSIYKKFTLEIFNSYANEFLIPMLLADALGLDKDKYSYDK